MKNVILKATGTFAIIAVMVISSVNTANAAEKVSTNKLTITTKSDLQLAPADWEFITRDFVLRGE